MRGAGTIVAVYLIPVLIAHSSRFTLVQDKIHEIRS